MPHELDKILIFASQQDFDEKIVEIRNAVVTQGGGLTRNSSYLKKFITS